MERMKLSELMGAHKENCAAFRYGKPCNTLGCLRRNWEVNLGSEGAYRFVGCLSFQTVAALEGVRQLGEQWNGCQDDIESLSAEVETLRNQST